MNADLLPKRTISIAFAEDHAGWHKLITDFLLKSGDFTILASAFNGKELIDLVEKSPSLPDLFMLDINMPVMNGYDTLEIIKLRWPQSKVVIFSSEDPNLFKGKMINRGANAFFYKSMDMDLLHEAILDVHFKGSTEIGL